MTATIDPWLFTTPPLAPREPQVVLIVFSLGPLADNIPLSMSRFGAPSAEALEQCAVRTIERATDPAWFDAWRTGSLRAIAEGDLGELAALDAADHAHVIVAGPEAPADLTYLQAAWVFARYLVARGGDIVLDALAMRYHVGAALPAGGPLDVANEIRVIFETDSTRSDRAHALHTRGLRKFGAPDLIALCTDADTALVHPAIAELADAVARGTDLALPRHALQVTPEVVWYAVADEHGLGALLSLDNVARVVVDEEGRDLTNVVARLDRSAN